MIRFFLSHYTFPLHGIRAVPLLILFFFFSILPILLHDIMAESSDQTQSLEKNKENSENATDDAIALLNLDILECRRSAS